MINLVKLKLEFAFLQGVIDERTLYKMARRLSGELKDHSWESIISMIADGSIVMYDEIGPATLAKLKPLVNWNAEERRWEIINALNN